MAIPWKIHGKHRKLIGTVHEFSMSFCPYELSMVIPWNGDAMSIPWKFHGNFIWAKTHGNLMDFSFDISMGYFCKGIYAVCSSSHHQMSTNSAYSAFTAARPTVRHCLAVTFATWRGKLISFYLKRIFLSPRDVYMMRFINLRFTYSLCAGCPRNDPNSVSLLFP